MKDNLYLSVVIISFNESIPVLTKTVNAVINHLKKQKFNSEIIISEGSSNKEYKTKVHELTQEKSKDFNIRVYNVIDDIGKGDAVKQGMKEASGELKLFCDFDDAVSFEQIDSLIAKINGADIAIASRYVKGAKTIPKRSFLRTFVARGGNIFINFVLRLHLKDTRCGFKLFKKEVADNIFPKLLIRTFAFDDEVFVLAKKFGYKVVEVPVEWHDIEALTGVPSGVKLKDILMSFFEVAQMKWNLWTGKYNN